MKRYLASLAHGAMRSSPWIVSLAAYGWFWAITRCHLSGSDFGMMLHCLLTGAMFGGCVVAHDRLIALRNTYKLLRNGDYGATRRISNTIG